MQFQSIGGFNFLPSTQPDARGGVAFGANQNMSSIYTPSKTEQKIKEIAQKPQPTKPAKIYTQDELFKKVDTAVEQYGMNPDEAMLELLNSAKSKGYAIEGYDIDSEIKTLSPQAPQPQEEKGMFGKLADFGQSIKPFTATDTSGMDTSSLGGAFKKSFFETVVDPLKSLGNIPGDAIQIVGQLGEAISSPVQTAKTLNDIGQGISDNIVYGILNNITGSDISDTDKAVMVQGITDSLGSLAKDPERMRQLLVENPVDVALTVQGGLQSIRSKITNPTLLKAVDNMIEATNPINMLKAEGSLVTAPISKVKTLLTPISRTTEEISANILQPYKGLADNLDDANKGLQRVIEGQNVSKSESFNSLLEKTNTKLGEFEQVLNEKLDSIVGLAKSKSANNALTQLKDIYSSVKSEKLQKVAERIDELLKKNKKQGLTASELQEVKRLHTQANNLFNEKGQITGGFSSDDLRAIRNELKTEIETRGINQGVSDIGELNKAYGEVLDTKMLLENQVKNVKSFAGRQLPETSWQKLGSLVGKIPMIKGGLQGLFQEAGISLRAGKINPLEVQKRLPALLKELQKAGMTQEDISLFKKTLQAIQENLKATGESVKTKVGEGFDTLADKTGARVKFIDDTKGTGISGKIEAPKELIEEARKYKSADEFVKAQEFVEAPKLKWDSIPEEGIQAEIPLNKLRVSSKALDRATKNTMKGNGSRTFGDIDVVMLKDGTFAINEGHHRAVQKILQKDKNIRARIYSSKDYFDGQVREWENLDTTFSKEKTLTESELRKIWEQANK